MNETLCEVVDSRGATMRVDRQQAVVRGVKVLGLVSQNGREYLPTALERAAPLYEGARVNVNHPAGDPRAARDYRDRIGSIHEVNYRPGEGLYGDLHFNPKHALAEQLAWDAEHGGENVGLSHNVEARVSRQNGRLVVEEIARVHSVDLVASPATTRGLYEAQEQALETEEATATETARLREENRQLVDQCHALRRWQTASRLVHQARQRLAAVDTELAETALDEALVEQAGSAADDAALRLIVEERVRLVETVAAQSRRARAERPRSVPQRLWEDGAGRIANAAEFVRAIRK